MDAEKYKNVTVRRGYKYHYYYSPATAGKPTLLFIQGFPSTSFDWSRQVAHFTPLGYGVLVPDCLGYGGTSKPTDWAEFRHKLIADDLVDVVDTEGLADVVAIGHDWGTALVSALVHHYQDRFHAFVWLAAAYFPPNPHAFDLEQMCATLKEATGSELFGYWKLLTAPHGARLIEEKMDSFLQLLYAADPDAWIEHFCPSGAIDKWLAEDRRPGLPKWLSEDEYKHIRNVLLEGGMTSPVNYYKVAANNGNLADHKALPEEQWYIKKPVLFFAATLDHVGRHAPNEETLAKYATNAEIIELNVGHWVQLEATDQMNEGLQQWLLKLPPASASLM
ncbi:alpha/beta-hydrolase [Epithele typhae]|uniref:alpha/beta-hydrolase n=1 Tax=Epithele typhae TaxID=378194 RepID=UPI002008949D|nr:alpha/beta-hydrolase [Epithele typhae]KAH9940057.1 alpha/beta-hydrolase [Epithele typhae]